MRVEASFVAPTSKPTTHHTTEYCQMYSRSVVRVGSLGVASSLAEGPPVFLAPAIYGGLQHYTVQTSSFSTSGQLSARIKGDRNRLRGVSAIHRTGPRAPLEVSRYPLPTPVPREQQPGRKLNRNHGLWKFFNKKRQPFPKPENDYAHGMEIFSKSCFVQSTGTVTDVICM